MNSLSSHKRMKCAVVGAGVAGITSAFLLQKKHDVTLFEKRERLGGHTNTVLIPDGPDAGALVDTGFIVLNDKTYPGLHRFLDVLGVKVRYSEMSFGFHSERTGFSYAGTGFNGLFADRVNAFRPDFYRFLWGIKKFAKRALLSLEDGSAAAKTLGEYARELDLSESVIDNYLLPMGAAIWSSPSNEMLSFPAETYIRFFKNHGLLSFVDRPRWQTVVGGSCAYVRAFEETFGGEIHTQADIVGVTRRENDALVKLSSGEEQVFDHVVIAAHADQALALLENPTPEERRLLGTWSYQHNTTILHWDTKVLPPLARAHASWNYRDEDLGDSRSRLSVTYDMNRLQGLSTKRHYCVTLNSGHPIDEDKIVTTLDYMHPVFTDSGVNAQAGLKAQRGTGTVWFCGSYFGYGFHEDAVQSAIEIGNEFGVAL